MGGGQDVHDASYYFKCMVGGILACGLTHTVMTPVDLMKCRKQVNPKLYPSITGGLKTAYAAEGLNGIKIGWVPTLFGYSAQGFAKFGFYEIFKDVYAGLFGQEFYANNRKIVWSMASASAEFIADVFLCPFEAIKVRQQTANPASSFPQSFTAALAQVQAKEGNAGLFKGIYPLWGRQIPYTVVKFVAFEEIVGIFYSKVFNAKPKNEYSKSLQLSVTFASGYLAGVFCAIVSHPADTMVSKLNNVQNDKGAAYNMKQIYNEIGFGGLWKGLGARIFMIGTLTGLQWWIYDTFKTAVGLQTTGGNIVKKA